MADYQEYRRRVLHKRWRRVLLTACLLYTSFYNDLNAACMDNTGKDIDALMAGKEYKSIVANLLEAAGLNYGALPKEMCIRDR